MDNHLCHLIKKSIAVPLRSKRQLPVPCHQKENRPYPREQKDNRPCPVAALQVPTLELCYTAAIARQLFLFLNFLPPLRGQVSQYGARRIKGAADRVVFCLPVAARAECIRQPQGGKSKCGGLDDALAAAINPLPEAPHFLTGNIS